MPTRFEPWIAVAFVAACASSALPPPAAERSSQGQPEVSGAAPDQRVGIAGEKQPLPGVTTGGKLTEADLRRAQQLGYRTVISLLPEADAPGEAEAAEKLGLRFVSIPIADASGLTEANARRLASAMDEPGAKPLIVHCSSGNRVGALLALRAFYVEGKSAREALELGERAGLTSLRPEVERRISQRP